MLIQSLYCEEVPALESFRPDYIWAKTESLAVATTVYHAAFDEVRDALENSIGFVPLVNVWQMSMIIIVGGLLLWKANWVKLCKLKNHEFDSLG